MRWMMEMFSPARPPAIAEATLRDAAPISALHGASFRRGWSEDEIEGLLTDRSVLGHRAMIGSRFAGFILSRMAADEAEILSVAVAARFQGRSIAGGLLRHHLGRLMAFGVHKVFLEVEENNIAALKLYRRAGFVEAGRREGYYPKAAGKSVAALVLRRDLV